MNLITAANGVKEKVLETRQPEVQPWAGRQYIAAGFQRIRGEGAPERQVFFLQTLEF